MDAPLATETPRPGVFISHSHLDRQFARRLGRDLEARGARCWIDEAEIGIGDSLLDKLSGAIQDLDYLAVVVSPRSATSEWVEREVAIAVEDERLRQTVKVLPILLRGATLPPSLSGRIYADFTSEPSYSTELTSLLTRLGIAAQTSPPGERIEELAALSPILGAALREIRGDGLARTTADALIASAVDDFDLSEFLCLLAHEARTQVVLGLAFSLIACIDRRLVGHDALDHCLRGGQLSEADLAQVGLKMQYVQGRDAVVWCHSRLTSVIRSDAYYNSFLNKHAPVVVDQCFDAMLEYLLVPDRGPANYNVDSFEIAIREATEPLPLQRRWIEWIENGRFDERDIPDSEDPEILYKILNENWGVEAFAPIVDAVHQHVHALLKSHDTGWIDSGLDHLDGMSRARYRGSARVLTQTVPRVYNLDPHRRQRLGEATRRLNSVPATDADSAY